MFLITYLNTFNEIKINFNTKKYIYVKQTTKTKNLILILLKYNLIIGYNKYNYKNKNFYKIYFNKNNSCKLHNLYKPTNYRYIKYKELIKFTNKYTQSNYVLSTSSGIITIKEALLLKKGGVLLFKLF